MLSYQSYVEWLTKSMEIIGFVSQWLKPWHLKPGCSFALDDRFPWKPVLGEGEADDRRDNCLASPRVELKAPGLSCSAAHHTEWQPPLFLQWQWACSQPRMANPEADWLPSSSSSFIKWKQSFIGCRRTPSHWETEVPLQYLHPMCLFFKLILLKAAQVFVNGVLFCMIPTALHSHSVQHEINRSVLEMKGKAVSPLYLRGFPFSDTVYRKALPNWTVAVGWPSQGQLHWWRGFDFIQMRPLSSDCLEINREEPGGSSNLPAQRQKLQRENSVWRCRQSYIPMMRAFGPVPHLRIPSVREEEESISPLGGKPTQMGIVCPSVIVSQGSGWLILQTRHLDVSGGSESLWGRLRPVFSSDLGRSPGAPSARLYSSPGKHGRKKCLIGGL